MSRLAPKHSIRKTAWFGIEWKHFLLLPSVIYLFLLAGCGRQSKERSAEGTQQQELVIIALPAPPPELGRSGSALVWPGAFVTLPTSVVDDVLEEDARLRRERADFLEVVRVARREISALTNERDILRLELEKASGEIKALRRDHGTEVNLLWSRAVAPLDARFAERARRFKIMLATRLRERGGDWPSDVAIMEPRDAREIFERQSRQAGTWAEDEPWLEQQWQGWRLYEETWRKARARIRRECENLRSETSERLIAAEEAFARNEEKIAQLEERARELARPLEEALAAAAQLQARRMAEAERCAPEILARLAPLAAFRLEDDHQQHQIPALPSGATILVPLKNEIGETLLLLAPAAPANPGATASPRLARLGELLQD